MPCAAIVSFRVNWNSIEFNKKVQFPAALFYVKTIAFLLLKRKRHHYFKTNIPAYIENPNAAGGFI